jgi:hypothetical protein
MTAQRRFLVLVFPAVSVDRGAGVRASLHQDRLPAWICHAGKRYQRQKVTLRGATPTQPESSTAFFERRQLYLVTTCWASLKTLASYSSSDPA